MGAPEIQDYQFKHMVIDGEPYTRDLIILPDRIVENWWRKNGHQLDIEDLGEVLAAGPKVLVVGTGAYGLVKVPRETRQAVEAAGIQLRAARTGKAWRLYNELREQQPTAGAFHLAC